MVLVFLCLKSDNVDINISYLAVQEDTDTVFNSQLSDVEGDIDTLARQAAASSGINILPTRTRQVTTEPRTQPSNVVSINRNRITAANVFSSEIGQGTYTIPKKVVNSNKFPKDIRPPHLQDDELVDSMDTNIVAQMVLTWKQIQVMEKSNELKSKKAESKNNMKKNNSIKSVKIQEGEDDSTNVFHKQRFSMRMPVVAPSKYWDLYPVEWKEVYYSVHLEHVGLENVLGQKQIALLHDRRSELKIHYFSQINANIGRDKVATNINIQKDGSADIKSQDDWAALATINELTMALDNLVAAWSCFWPGEQSMVTIRRVVTRLDSFSSVSDIKSRKKLLETFLNKMLEINSRRAAQGEVPLTYKEVLEQAKEYLETPNNYVRRDVENRDTKHSMPVKREFIKNSFVNSSNKKFKPTDYWELVKNIKVEGNEICLDYNKLEGCKEGNSCRRAHRCAYMERGEMKRVCGRRHSKVKHHEMKDK